MFHKMPLILLATILAIVFLDPLLPIQFKQIIYSISLTIKEIIIFLLPIIIFSLLFKSMVMLSNSASKIIGLILVLVCCSNFLSTLLSRFVGTWIYNFDLPILIPNDSSELSTLWSIHLPKLIANNKAMFSGIILGLVLSKTRPVLASKIAIYLENFVGKLLNWFTYLIPLFVAGFIVKLQYEGVVSVILRDYTAIFAFIALAQFGYLALAYFLLSNFSFKKAISSIKNMMPAAISGFSTMSSAVSMPLTIIAAEKNARNKDIARSVIPATVNIHLVGDCFAIPIFAYAVLKSFGIAEPSLMSYLAFAFYFVLAKFSVAAVPGGGILVMLPILESYLGFNGAMMSLITALYILFDPVITCANVLGNGAFAKLIDKMSRNVHS